MNRTLSSPRNNPRHQRKLLDPALGQRLLYASYVGGRGAEKGRGVAVDDRGAAYFTGETDSRDFPTTRRAFQTIPRAGATDAFVITLAPNRRR